MTFEERNIRWINSEINYKFDDIDSATRFFEEYNIFMCERNNIKELAKMCVNISNNGGFIQCKKMEDGNYGLFSKSKSYSNVVYKENSYMVDLI